MDHPKSLLLIEKHGKLLWRLVDRETTDTGLSHSFNVLAENIPRYPIARQVFNSIKGSIYDARLGA